jgi:predicted TIM-barrel fold metal-dependent hydrolase
VLLRGTASAQLAASAQTGLIDVHHHVLPPFYRDAVVDLQPTSGGLHPAWQGRWWTPQRALDEMDRHGVATAVVSYSTPGVWLGEARRSRELARRCNDFAAGLVKDHPRRFGFFAALPLPDTEGSLREAAHALDRLDASGIGLLTSYDGKWLGDAAFAPVLDELDRRKAVVYVHPAAPDCCSKLMSDVPAFLTEYVQETNRAITSLMFSGALMRYRDIRFIFSHAGGTMPMLAGRVAQLSNLPRLAPKVPNGVEYELKRFFYEIANSANRPAMAALTSLIPITQIMLGTDYPFIPISATAAGIHKLDLSEADVLAIGRHNAARLLPRLAS